MDGEYGQKNNATTRKQSNTLPYHGNEASMNLNSLILTNIQSSSYFKVTLFKLKTYHEVIDEIYYQVRHLEPWERGSRKTSGQTGMCGGVRGVGAGGIVSSAFCLLYKLYTLRLTRKQVNGLISHADSPYIRALGFMYIRFTQPPADLFDWYEEYLQDEEEIDVKAGGGQMMRIGHMLQQWLTKLDWFSTLFPRIPVPIQKQIESKLNNYYRMHNITAAVKNVPSQPVEPDRQVAAPGRGGGGGGGREMGGGREAGAGREMSGSREAGGERGGRDMAGDRGGREMHGGERGGRDMDRYAERDVDRYAERTERDRYERGERTERYDDRHEPKRLKRSRSREKQRRRSKSRDRRDRDRDRHHRRTSRDRESSRKHRSRSPDDRRHR